MANLSASTEVGPPETPDDIVITGIGGRYPDCDNPQEFWEKLVEGVELSSIDDRRWPVGYLSLPHRSGKIRDISKCDYEFFKMTEQEANYTDVQMRILLETTYESICDAGIEPSTLRGTNTAVFAGICYDDTGTAYGEDEANSLNYLRLSIQRVARAFDFRGCSSSVDTACASSFTAFFQAFHSLRAGLCDRALVCGCAIHLRPTIAAGFNNLRMTSKDGRSKCMDASADGYGRSEAVVSILLQRRADAKRVYATVLNTKTNTDGYKGEGITFPSIDSQHRLMSTTQNETGIHPHQMKYIEAHMTGTPAGDVVESESIRRTFCEDGREDPLKVGCLKSNLGHTEGASGTCALTKVCLAFEKGELPPNLHMNTPNPNIEGLKSGILSPVTSRQKFNEKIVGLSSFGFGGCNVYSILRANDKEIAADAYDICHPIPRIINASGRTEDSVGSVFDYVRHNRPMVTNEFLALLADTMKTKPENGMKYRGYMLIDGPNAIEQKVAPIHQTRPLWFVFPSVGSLKQWTRLNSSIMRVDAFAASITRSAGICLDLGLDLNEILFGQRQVLLADALVATVAVQIALVELLQHLGVQPDGIVGHSLGEVACAFADGALTAEQTLRVAHAIGKSLTSTFNGSIISGLDLEQLGLHTDKIGAARNLITEVVNAALSDAKTSGAVNGRRSSPSSWISTSIPVQQWSEFNSSKLSGEYYSNALTSSTHFSDAMDYVPKNAIMVELSIGSTLEPIMRKRLGPDVAIVSMLGRTTGADSVTALLHSLGSLYLAGTNLNIERLYPAVQYPVGRGTLSISPLIKWDHSKSCTVTKHPEYFNVINSNIPYEIDIMQPQQQYLSGHVIDGRNLVPAVEYLRMVWEAAIANVKGSREYMKFPVEFKRVRLLRGILLNKQRASNLLIKFVRETGEFEVFEGHQLCCNGIICLLDPSNSSTTEIESLVRPVGDPEAVTMLTKDIYKEFRVRGYDYQASFQGIVEASSDGTKGRVKWMGHWVSFADSMLQLALVGQSERCLRIPTYIDYIRCDSDAMLQHIEACKDEMGESIVDVVFDKNIGVGASPGIVICGLKTSEIARRQGAQKATVESYSFVPLSSQATLSSDVQRELAQYSNHCSTMISNINRGESIHFDTIKKFCETGSERYTLLRTLVESFEEAATGRCRSQPSADEDNADTSDKEISMSNDEEFEFDINRMKAHIHEVLRNHFESNKDDLGNDMFIVEPLSNEALTRHQLDVFIENCSTRLVKAVEVNNTATPLNEVISELLDSNQLQVDYRMVSTRPSGNGATLISWSKQLESGSNAIPTDVSDVDLLIYKDESTELVVSKQQRSTRAISNVRQFFESAFSVLNENAFALIFVRTKLSQLEETLLECIEQQPLKTESLTIDGAKLRSMCEEIGFKHIGTKEDELGFCSILLRKPVVAQPDSESPIVIPIRTSSYDWVNEIKKHLTTPDSDKKKDEDAQPEAEESSTSANESEKPIEKPKDNKDKSRVWLIAEDSPNGLTGLINCLRREPGCAARVRCLINLDGSSVGTKDPRINSVNDLSRIPADILENDLSINVISGGQRGTLRHSLIEEDLEQQKDTEHAYVDVKTKGDMSSFRWIENNTKYFEKVSGFDQQEILCEVYYAPLNFKDVMIASGRISTDAYPTGLGMTAGHLGMEFAGRDSNGNRVMGYTFGKGIATKVLAHSSLFTWPVPANWSLEEAATIPIVYSTVYYALFIRAQIRPGDSVLIHSGAGGVGQAAINVCKQLGCPVFTTCGSDEKRKFLMEQFGLRPKQIANSRDLTFEEHILRETNGRGVDIVLNSLSEDKLKASIRCLADGGRFVEIGKYDLLVNSRLDMSEFGANKSLQTVCLAHLDVDAFINNNPSALSMRRQIYQLIQNGIKNAEVKPLRTHVFGRDQVEEAFRFMASGKHIGKVMVKVRDEEPPTVARQSESKPLLMQAVRQTFFDPTKSYIITGGLGGFGLELAYWMVTRGCRKLVLTSRTGIKDNYQLVAIRRLKSYMRGCSVEVSKADITTENGARDVILEAQKLGPVGGIFNLAMVLKDAALENQTPASFRDCCLSKVDGTIYLDQFARVLCPNIEYFVCFSSVVAGRGNAGQTNYGFANATMERICEKRKKDGLAGLAIQWGAIGDVGIVAEMLGGNDVIIGGTSVPQRIPSCMEVLDQFLLSPHAIVSSIVKVSKKKQLAGSNGGLLETVCHILGIKEPSKLDPKATLGELGMDSLMAIEIKQGLEREYEVVLSTQEIRNMTIKGLKELDVQVAEKRAKKAEEEAEKKKEEAQGTGTDANSQEVVATNEDIEIKL